MTQTQTETATTTSARSALRWRRAVRAAAGCPGTNVPVDVCDGDEAPHIEGGSFHYTTRTGTPVRYPSAYARKGWSSLVYNPSTRRVVVGREWRP